MTRTLFFKRNQVRTRRVAIVTAALLAGLTAATVFLCIRPSMAPAVAGTLPALSAATTGQPTQPAQRGVQAATQGEAEAAALARESGELVTLADRHASDALRMAAQGAVPAESVDDLGWDYVQLRL